MHWLSWLAKINFRGHVIGIFAILAATALHYCIELFAGSLNPFSAYILAILFTAWYCGRGPALVGLILGIIVPAYIFLYPIGSVQIHALESQIGAVLFIVVGLSSIFFTESMRNAQRKAVAYAEEALAKQKNLEVEVQHRQRIQRDHTELLHKFVDAQEEERRRISRELHDQCGQEVTALQLGLKLLLDNHEDRANDAINNKAQDLYVVLDRLSREIHDLALELRPPSLDEMGLRAALESYLALWSNRTRILVDFECNVRDVKAIPADKCTALYRVVQESLNNVAKHSHSPTVSVVLEKRPKEVAVIIEDQGSGFKTDSVINQTGAPSHLGLLGMQERMESVGGTLELESSVGAGTTIFAKVPLP